ncbi:PilZ domain-containing protein [Sphingomonas sp. CROZ-RG-20F-R02-07]|uniref:PilZ domain-containing protein n=1 Tax=Sphingomonas sp. CROZ-RG-20F-R02-07 TaxID=2914832 RepID=UPI001F59C8A4|nr:PilZ domain-containing protein [Sphingomonas sp. CROZ-RG-20F-R02-07]
MGMMVGIDDANADDGNAVRSDQRREGKRHALVLLVGKVMQRGEISACLVHDISPTGLMARFTAMPAVGDRIDVEVRGLPPIAATVRWVRGPKAGCEFDERQDVDAVFRIKRDDGLVARTPRFPLVTAASLRLGGERLKAHVLDISPGGVKLESAAPVQRGQAGQVTLTDSATALFGTVCWAYDGRFGFRFVAPLPLASLAQILDGSGG